MDLEGRQDPGQGRQGREAAGPLPSFSTQVFQSPAPRCPAGRVSRLLPLVSLTLSQVAYGSASGHLWHLLGSQAAHQACLLFWGSPRRCAGAREGAGDAVKLVLLPGLRRALPSLSLPRPGGLSPGWNRRARRCILLVRASAGGQQERRVLVPPRAGPWPRVLATPRGEPAEPARGLRLLVVPGRPPGLQPACGASTASLDTRVTFSAVSVLIERARETIDFSGSARVKGGRDVGVLGTQHASDFPLSCRWELRLEM